MNRLLLWLTGILLVSTLGLGWAAKAQYDRAEYLRIENKAFAEALERAAVREERDRKVLVARQARVASTARKLAEAQQALSEALNSDAVYTDANGVQQRNSDWSNTSVPQDVQDALAGPSGGLPDGLPEPAEVRP